MKQKGERDALVVSENQRASAAVVIRDWLIGSELAVLRSTQCTVFVLDSECNPITLRKAFSG